MMEATADTRPLPRRDGEALPPGGTADRPEDEREPSVIVLPDVVELPWEPYYLEPPD